MAALPRARVPVNTARASPRACRAQESSPASLSLGRPSRRSVPALSPLMPIMGKPFSSSVFALSDELSLLPPRSARRGPPPRLATRLLQPTPAPLPCTAHRPPREHRQFSVQLNSIGTLQHVSYRVPTSMATALSSSFTYILCSLPRRSVPYRGARFIPPRQSCLPELAHYARPSPQCFCACTPWLIRSSFATCVKRPLLYLASLRSRAVLKHISGGTSYQTVRLVFRPYARLLPSICTSEPRTASGCLSSAFTDAGHSSLVYRVACPQLCRLRSAQGSRPSDSLCTCSPWSVFQDGAEPLGSLRNFTFSVYSFFVRTTSPLSVSRRI
ncbi:hypothetical protein M153_7960002914 [Pseudoloma neurophilia]|uniref:Uncharacterized protein n=1 Tax=Pseudoloma neurophilia TaxID=146866 RepID=A0A0R0M550_9MICR|nr:hypothetical protein M153_7960002914 [Pseudoloma neurophilia]